MTTAELDAIVIEKLQSEISIDFLAEAGYISAVVRATLAALAEAGYISLEAPS